MAVGTQDLRFRVLAQVVGAQSLDALRGSFDSLNKKADTLGKGLKALAGFYSATKAVEFGKGILESADQLAKMSQKTGIAVETLDGLKAAAELAGLPFDGLATGLRKLSLNLVEAANGNQELGGVFKQLGVSIRDSSGNIRSSDKVLADLADRFHNLQDGPGKAAAAIKVFGKAGTDLIPLLNQGSASLKEFSEGIDTDFAKRAEVFNDTITEIGQSLKSGAVSSLREMLPALQEIGSAFLELSKSKTESIGFFTALGEVARLVSQAIVVGFFAVTEVIDRTVTTLREAKLELKALTGLASEADADAYGKLKRGFADRQTARDRAEKKFLQQSNQGSVLFGDGKAAENTKPVEKKAGQIFDPDSIGENAKILKQFEEKLAKLRAETATYGQSNAEKERAVLLAELESKGISKSSAAYQKLKGQITSVVNARETAKEKQVASDYLRDQQQQIDLEALQLQQIDLTTVEYQKLTTARQIDNQTAQATKNFTQQGAAAYRDAAESVKEQKLALIDLQEAQKQTFSSGAKAAMKEYVENARDIAAQVKNVFTVAFKGMEDALVSFTKTGKLNFTQFADDVITEVIRIQVRMLIAQAATGASSLFAGAFGSTGGTVAGSTVNGAQYATPAAFANGGIMTSRGSLPLRAYAAGGVANSPQLAMFGEGSRPEAYVPLPDGRSIPVSVRGGAGAGGGDINVSVQVNVEKGTESSQSESKTGSDLGKLIAGAVKNQIILEKRPGGLLS